MDMSARAIFTLFCFLITVTGAGSVSAQAADKIVIAQNEETEEDGGGFFSNIFNRNRGGNTGRPIYMNNQQQRISPQGRAGISHRKVTPPKTSFDEGMQLTRRNNELASLADAQARRQQVQSSVNQYRNAYEQRMAAMAEEMREAGVIPDQQGQGTTLRERAGENIRQKYDRRRENMLTDPVRLFNNVK